MSIKKTIEIVKDHNLMSWLLINGYKIINKKTKKNTIPKFLFESILISSI
mgnify:CR=1 FL=1